jgi:hypothetical protein
MIELCLTCHLRPEPEFDAAMQFARRLPRCKCSSPEITRLAFDPVRQRLVRASDSSVAIEGAKPEPAQLDLGVAA